MRLTLILTLVALVATPLLAAEPVFLPPEAGTVAEATWQPLASQLPAVQANYQQPVAQEPTDGGGQTVIDYIAAIIGVLDTPTLIYNFDTEQFSLGLAGKYKVAAPTPWLDINVSALARSEDGIRFGAGVGATLKRIGSIVDVTGGLDLHGKWLLGLSFTK